MAFLAAMGWSVVWTVAFLDQIRLFYDIKTYKPNVLRDHRFLCETLFSFDGWPRKLVYSMLSVVGAFFASKR